MTPHSFIHPGKYLFRQGSQHGNTLYIVVAGEGKVIESQGEGRADKEIRRCRAGDFFEEQALIDSSYQPKHSVVAVSNLSCFLLTKQDFYSITKSVEMDPSLLHSIHEKPQHHSGTQNSHMHHAHSGIRRITAFNDLNQKDGEKARRILKRMCTFMAESMWASLYFRVFRDLVILPEKLFEYGEHAHKIMSSSRDRGKAVEAISHTVKHILVKKSLDRTHDDCLFILAILKQKNQLTGNFCQSWSPLQLNLLVKKAKIAHSLPLHKISEVDHPAHCAFLLLKGCVRVFSPVVDRGPFDFMFHFIN